MSEKFDFSKIKDQKKFDQLPPEDKGVIIGEAQIEAKEMHEQKEKTEIEQPASGNLKKHNMKKICLLHFDCDISHCRYFLYFFHQSRALRIATQLRHSHILYNTHYIPTFCRKPECQ